MILNKFGCETLTALNGREVLEILRAHRSIDLIFLDLRMPVKDGYKVIEEIRKDEHLEDLPIIIISAEGREKEIKRAMELGANGYILKPFGLEELSAVARKWLSRKD